MSAGVSGPWVRTIGLAAPTLADNTADAERLAGALKRELGGEVDIELDLLRRLPGLLREHGYRVRCTVYPDRGRWALAGVDAVETERVAAGIAVDLGTTRIALRLVDLTTGEPLADHGIDNPQAAIGPDVLARIHHADTPGGLCELQRLVVDGLNDAIAAVCRMAGLAPAAVSLVTVAGNTAMTHLFLGLEPRWMVREPYLPAVNRPGILRAADLGLRAGPWARVLIFPNIGSYFGGDLVGGEQAFRRHGLGQEGVEAALHDGNAVAHGGAD